MDLETSLCLHKPCAAQLESLSWEENRIMHLSCIFWDEQVKKLHLLESQIDLFLLDSKYFCRHSKELF